MGQPASAIEVNFDCLVGPTHHFGGLSPGNMASTANKSRPSSPRRAALQGLEKMRFLYERGYSQAILPPHPRPHLETLATQGLGEGMHALEEVYKKNPFLFFCLSSSSFMWAANAATVAPSSDTKDGKLHIMPANLHTMFHRSLESPFTQKIFTEIFKDQSHFVVHPPLPHHDIFADEGAANHNRFAPKYGQRGLHLFVYSKEPPHPGKARHFPSRQSKLASEAIISLFGLDERYAITALQNPEAIDCGAFHNDVVAVANENCLLLHESAFIDTRGLIALLKERYREAAKTELQVILIENAELTLGEAVSTYLFNSQLLTKNTGKMLLFAPKECESHTRARAIIDRMVQNGSIIDEVAFFDISESMANGGGPACLRLRVVLNHAELKAMHQGVLFSLPLYMKLRGIIERYYADDLKIDHFFQESFHAACSQAQMEIMAALGLMP